MAMQGGSGGGGSNNNSFHNSCAIVAEIGNYTTRMGYAGEDYPRSVFTSNAAFQHRKRQQQQQQEQEEEEETEKPRMKLDYLTHPLCRAIGSIPPYEIDDCDGNWEVHNPVDPNTGLLFRSPKKTTSKSENAPTPSAGSHSSYNANERKITNGGGDEEEDDDGDDAYELFDRYLRHGYSSALTGVQHSDGAPLLLVEKAYNIPPVRQRTLEVLFESGHNNNDDNDESSPIPAAFLARDATMACYAVGRTTGTVVDLGHSSTTVSPVFDGYIEARGIVRGVAGAGRYMDRIILDRMDQLFLDQRDHQHHNKKLRQQSNEQNNEEDAAAMETTQRGNERQEQTASIDAPPYVMPLYQTRMKDYAKRKESIHRLARLDLARDCKECGAGLVVAPFGYVPSSSAASDAASQNQNHDSSSTHNKRSLDSNAKTDTAPRMPYRLPDGTILDIDLPFRMDSAELLFGSDGYAAAEQREDWALKMTRKLDDLSLACSALSSSSSAAGSTTDSTLEMLNAAGLLKKQRTTINLHSSYSSSNTTTNNTTRRRRPPSLSRNDVAAAAHAHLSNSILDLSPAPLQSMVCDAAFKCDRDQQAQLLGNVILCGGGSCLGPDDSSVPNRLRDEVEHIIHSHTPGWRVKVSTPPRTERAICSWLGGSILASLSSFHDMWITRTEYEEYGPAIVNRKCP